MERISTAEKWAWVLTASLAPAAQFLADWTWYLLPAAALAAAIFWNLSHVGGGRLRNLLGLAAVALLLCRSVGVMADGWQNFGSSPVMPLMLLALALWSVWRGSQRCRRACCALFWIAVLLLAAVVLAAVGDLRWERLAATNLRWSVDGVWVLLLPCIGLMEERPHRGRGYWMLTLTATVTALSFVTWGCLGDQGSFYDLAGSLNLFGVVQRLDPLVAAGLTVSWFAFAGYLLSAAQAFSARLWPGAPQWGLPVLLCAAAAACLLLNVSPDGLWSAIAVGIYALWGLFSGKNRVKKKFEKF